ncbi:MAG: hypothetical protein K2J83_03200, partial [Clostridia bacterium]|nr:hypothetical protein [Clostridia bacterium]
MKIHKRNIATIILAILCAIALIICVSFAAPKSTTKSVNATTTTISPEIVINDADSRYYTKTGTTAYNTLNYSAMSTANAGGVAVTSTADTINISETTAAKPTQAAYISFNIKVNVPAHTEYTVKFYFSLTVVRGGTVVSSSTLSVASTCLYYLPNGGYVTTINNGTGAGALAFAKTSTAISSIHTPASATGDQEIVFTNNSSTPQDITSHGAFGFFGCSQTATSSPHQTVSDLVITDSTLEQEVKFGIPTPTATKTQDIYTGSPLAFPIEYDDSNSYIDSVTGTDFYGTAISISLSDIDLATGTFKPTLAGTYIVKFKLTQSNINDGYDWLDGVAGTAEQSLTFTVKQKSLTVPTLQNTTQTYDPNGCNFGVSSNYDSTKMTASGVTNGIIWNASNTHFEAKEVGSYTVKFHLDDLNYIWDIGSGTTADQTATVKIEPKKLNFPTVSNPQEYTGSALTFVLSDFDGGQYISMDGVTPPNGATVTDAVGVTPTDTTDTFKAIKVGKYAVTLSIRDTKNYTWTDGTTTAKTVDFEITKKELLSKPIVSSSVNAIGGAEWNYGANSVTVTVTDDRVSGENINLLFYYDSKANTLTNVTTTGNTSVITMPANIPVGTYTLYVELNGTAGDNANYKLTSNNTLDFEVTAAAVDPTTYGWIYTKDGA